uniref:Rab-GAP TBC domain-containing protein n=1 Tax=Spongospora subterranea TaxID=70186 RepID=A0A0H5RCN1_9EUKA|eukprot:CRZ12020.1 hypothetical protein [Spongospora subterranea]
MGICHCGSIGPDKTPTPPSPIPEIILDEYGFILHHNRYRLSDLSLISDQDQTRSLIWQSIIAGSDTVTTWRSDLVMARELSWSGIPCTIRHKAWYILSGAQSLKALSPISYAQYLLEPCPTAHRQIEVDIPRTYSEHRYFTESGLGRERLKRLLHGLAIRLGPDTGYVQGMNMIAALLLLVFDNDEESAFWTLAAYMEQLNMKRLYQDGMDYLTLCLHRLGRLISTTYPQLEHHFGKENIEPFCYGTPWFLTLFAYNLPIRQCCRVFDAAFALNMGEELIYRFSLTYIRRVLPDLLRCQFSDATTLLKIIEIDDNDIGDIMKESLTMKIELELDQSGEAGAKRFHKTDDPVDVYSGYTENGATKDHHI